MKRTTVVVILCPLESVDYTDNKPSMDDFFGVKGSGNTYPLVEQTLLHCQEVDDELEVKRSPRSHHEQRGNIIKDMYGHTRVDHVFPLEFVRAFRKKENENEGKGQRIIVQTGQPI